METIITSSEFPWNELRSSSSCRSLISVTLILCHRCQLLTSRICSPLLFPWNKAHMRHETGQMIHRQPFTIPEILFLRYWKDCRSSPQPVLIKMGDGLQLRFVLLLCLNFCHGRDFLLQEALETGAKADLLVIHSDLLWQKSIPNTSEPRAFIPQGERCRS